MDELSPSEVEYLEQITGVNMGANLAKAAGIANEGGGQVLVQKGFLLDDTILNDWRGLIENGYGGIQDRILREAERKAPIVSAAINLRRMQCRPFARRSDDPSKPGFRIKTRDPNYAPTKEDKKTINELEDWFLFAGRTDHRAALDRDNDMQSVMKMAMAEYMIIDKVAIEVRHDSKGRLFDFMPLDASTIRKVLPTGIRANKSDFRFNPFITKTEIAERMEKERISQFPAKLEEIAYVQLIDDRLTAGFTANDLIFSIRQERTDVRFRGQGYSPLEQAISCITAFVNTMQWNSENFNGSAIPKVALVAEQGGFDKPSLRALQREWQANFMGRGQFKIPMLNGKWTALDLLKNNREMEYDKYIKFVSALCLAVLGVDATELGLKLNDSQPILGENADGKMQHSKSRGLHDLLGALASIWNIILRRNGYAKFEFEYTGIEPKDKDAEQTLLNSQVRSYKTIDEVRATQDMAPLPDGQGKIILDTTFQQAAQAAKMEAQASGDGGGGDFGDFGDIMNDAIDESVDDADLAKANKITAVKIRKPRTMLL